MASIISSTKVSDIAQADGRRYIRVKFVCEDNDSAQIDYFVGPKLVASDFDVDTWKSGYGDTVLAQLAEREEEEGLEMTDVGNPQTYALNPKWSTSKKIAKKMIYWMMRERDPRIVIWLEPLITYLDANYTNQQLANFLDITIPQLSKMNSRIQAILNAPDPAKSAKDLIADFDAESEEF